MNFRWLLISLSGALVIVGAGLSILKHRANPLFHPAPWLHLAPLTRELASVGVGLAMAMLVILLTRVTVRHTNWARRLHQDLRPIAQQMSPALILLVAVLSSGGEELMFRSFLTPWVGVVPQAILFGLLHQVAGPSRWVWVIWATTAGLAFGVMYQTFGTLSGPIVAHCVINGVNLMFLRSHDPDL